MGKIRIQKHHLGQLSAGVAAVCHSNRTVRLPKGKEIVYSVSGHSHFMPLSLKSFHQFLLLSGCHSCKNRILPADLIKINIFPKGRQIYRLPPLFQSGSLPDHGNGFYMISGNDFYIHSLFFEKLQGLLCVLPDPVLQDHGIQHMDPGRKDIFFCPGSSVVSDPYYSSSLF